MSEPASATWRALGTTVSVLVTSREALAPAREVLVAELECVDRACSRFRDDSDLMRVNRADGRPVQVSETLLEHLQAALRVAVMTGGSVVPTLGRNLRELGYDRDFAAGLDGRGTERPVAPAGEVRLDRERRMVSVSDGAELDLGATAKALTADRSARRIASETGAGVLVNLGGDLALAGPVPAGGWRVRVGDDATGPVVALASGGLATSSTVVRAWRRMGQARHHIVDPRTGGSCSAVWRTATVAAASCVEANAASTAAIVRGAQSPGWLAARALPARLVARGGGVVRVAGWPPG